MSNALKMLKKKHAEELADIAHEHDQMRALLAAAVMRSGGEITLGSATIHAALEGVEITVSATADGGLLVRTETATEAN